MDGHGQARTGNSGLKIALRVLMQSVAAGRFSSQSFCSTLMNPFTAISQNLDEMELSLMEFPNNFQSQNMDNSGNFSIQVIIEALAPYGLQLIRFFSSDPRAISARHNTCNEEAFICHRNKNWFTYRKIGDTW